MNFQEAILVPTRIAETVADEIEQMYDVITKRAYEIFLQRGGIGALDLEDWLRAEQELIFKPEVHIEETQHGIAVRVRIGKVSPVNLQALVTPDAMLVQGEDAAASKKVFRTIEFPRRIDVRTAEARYANGCLVFTAA